MPISFNPDSYKNVFPGEVTYSKVIPSAGDNQRDVWNVHIAVLKETTPGVFEKQPSNQACGIQNCQEMVIHRHNFLYENPRPGSPIAQFIFRMKDQGLIITEPEQLEGKRFQFEEVKVVGGMNPTTGQKGKDRNYYYIIGPIGFEPPEEDHDASELPSPVAQTNGTGETNGVAPVAPPVNSQTATPINDLYQRLAVIADGRNIDQIRTEARGIPELFDNKMFWLSILNGSAMTRAMEMKLIQSDDQGVFHKVA